jgi:ABC-type uncharacterized transport system permease subunit
VIHLSAFVFYLGALVPWVYLLVRGARGHTVLLASGLTGVAVALHAMALVDFWLTFGELPLGGLAPALSSLAFVGGLTLVAMLLMREVARLALGLLPFVLVLQGAALALGIEPTPGDLDFQGAGFVLHVALAFLGLQGLAVSSAAGVLYIVQHHELKVKRLGRLFQFIPPLATLERVGRTGLSVGFVSLSLALVLGWAWTVQNRGSLEIEDPKVLWAVMSWMVFLGIFAARRGKGRSEYRSALAAVIGFGIVIGTYLALRITAGGSGLFL